MSSPNFRNESMSFERGGTIRVVQNEFCRIVWEQLVLEQVRPHVRGETRFEVFFEIFFEAFVVSRLAFGLEAAQFGSGALEVTKGLASGAVD